MTFRPRLSLWRRIRRWWHMRLRGLTPAAADDLVDGLDLADHEIRLPPIRLRPPARPGRLPKGPAVSDRPLVAECRTQEGPE